MVLSITFLTLAVVFRLLAWGAETATHHTFTIDEYTKAFKAKRAKRLFESLALISYVGFIIALMITGVVILISALM